MEIFELIQKAHKNSKAHGFWEDFEQVEDNKQLNKEISQRLLLIIGEVTEAMEALRKNDMENFNEEIADTVIRLADLCGGLSIDLEGEIYKKMKVNEARPYKHGKAF